MNKLKAVARSVSFNSKPASASKNNRYEKDKLEPVVGFQVTLCDAAAENTSGEWLVRGDFEWILIDEF
jgi:hypothetical protein